MKSRECNRAGFGLHFRVHRGNLSEVQWQRLRNSLELLRLEVETKGGIEIADASLFRPVLVDAAVR